MRLSRWLIALLLAVFSGIVSAQEQDELLPCPSAGIVCQLPSAWTLAQLQAEIGALEPGQSGFVSRDDELTFVYRLSSTTYDRAAALFTFLVTDEVDMEPVEDSDWQVITLKLQFARPDEAILSFGIVEHGQGGNHFMFPAAAWRGSHAPPAPPANNPLQGIQHVISYKSEALKESRDIYIYVPPNFDPEQTTYPVIYMTDGESLPAYAPLVDFLITEGNIPPLVMIGTASAYPRGGVNRRGNEYVFGRNTESFEAHERFFTQEVRERATTLLNVSTKREDNILFGYSNGGLFAAAMSIRHPDLYGTILPFSAGASAGDGGISITKENILLPLKVYATAGTLEPVFYTSTRAFIRAYHTAGASAMFVERTAGHDDAMWQVEFVNALKWAFAKK